MNYYSFHIGDFVAATVHLTPLEELAYRRLLDMYYDTEQPIPLETERVSRRLRLDTETVETVLSEFFEKTDQGYRNSRCDEEIEAYQRKADQARLNGKSGGRPKKTNPVSAGNQVETGSKANQEPGTNNQHKDKNKDVGKSPPSSDVSEVFEFWKLTMASPRSLLDTKRQKLIAAAMKTGYTSEQLREAIRGCSLSPFHMGKNDRNTKYNGLDLILRNAEQIDKFIAVAANPESGRRPRTIHDISTMDYSKGVSDDGSF